MCMHTYLLLNEIKISEIQNTEVWGLFSSSFLHSFLFCLFVCLFVCLFPSGYRSEGVTCGICMDVVKAKPVPSEQKFGILCGYPNSSSSMFRRLRYDERQLCICTLFCTFRFWQTMCYPSSRLVSSMYCKHFSFDLSSPLTEKYI